MPRRLRYKSHHRSASETNPSCVHTHSDAGQTDDRDRHTKVGQYWQMRWYICRVLSRGVGGDCGRADGGRGERGQTAGMHRNCAHCLMHTRRLESPLCPASCLKLRFVRLCDARCCCGRKRASMIYRLFSRSRVRRFIFRGRMSHSS